MNEQARDSQLNIVTEEHQQGFTDSLHHNRYEPTSYELLDILFEHYHLTPEDQFVDVGCGKGRLNFYVHHFFGAKSVGIEMNTAFYEEALENKKRYFTKHKGANACISFYNCLAQDYQITDQDNTFYFFNPFSMQVFINFINQVMRSAEKVPRTVDVVLFFAPREYGDYLETSTAFQLVKEVPLPDFHKDPRERFLIYRLYKMD